MALKYTEMGYCVIPLNPYSKAPFFQVKDFQERQSTKAEIKKWWYEFPMAMIGIMTGKISGLFVLDIDPEHDPQKLSEFISNDFITPTANTPRGGCHLYMAYPEDEKITIKAGIFLGVDYRCNGGFVVAPPSRNSYDKQYTWEDGLSIFDVAPAPIPDLLYNYILDYNKHSFNYSYREGVDKGSQVANNLFSIGRRDEDLFHVANALVKGNADSDRLNYVMEIIAKNCNPPFPENELSEKIKSAIQRANRRERQLSDEVRGWVMSTTGHFLSTEIHKTLDLSTRVHKKNVSEILRRMCEEGIIEKFGNKNGSWRKIDREFKEQCWWEAGGLPANIRFPLDIENYVKIFPGNIILLEGQKSQGKSAFALEFCRLNKTLYKHKILYQNVEMSDEELLERFNSYGDIMTPAEWRETVTFIHQTGEWWDKVDPDGLNVIDYLVEYKESYLIADFVWRIHQKLKGGIALIVVQRDPLKPYPTGGRGVRDIPRLVISLIHHKLKLEDVKSFHKSPHGNPSGLFKKYKQANWWNFIPVGNWERQEDEKYKEFTIGD